MARTKQTARKSSTSDSKSETSHGDHRIKKSKKSENRAARKLSKCWSEDVLPTPREKALGLDVGQLVHFKTHDYVTVHEKTATEVGYCTRSVYFDKVASGVYYGYLKINGKKVFVHFGLQYIKTLHIAL